MSFGGSRRGGGTSTTTTSTALPAWLQPFAESFIKGYGAEAFGPGWQPGMQARPNVEIAPFSQEQLSAMSNIAGMTPATQALAGMGGTEAGKTLSGAYLRPASNPFLTGTFETAARDLTNAYQTAVAPSIMAAAQRAGQFGSSAMNEELALSRYGLGRNLENLATDIFGRNYQLERERQLRELGLLPQTIESLYLPQYTLMGVGATKQEQEQARREFPFSVLSGFGGALGQAGSGAGQSQTVSSMPRGGK